MAQYLRCFGFLGVGPHPRDTCEAIPNGVRVFIEGPHYFQDITLEGP